MRQTSSPPLSESFRVWVTVWVRQLTHILARTIFCVFATKKASKTEVFDAFCRVLTEKMQVQSLVPQGFAGF